MPPPPLLKIDESNRSAHYYIEEAHECFFFHEYTARKGYGHSAGNQLVINLKKSVLLKGQPQYRHKVQAIGECASMLRTAFDKAAWLYKEATIAPLPPSKVPTHPEYDDRMAQIVRRACDARGADVRQLVMQAQSYEASHTRADGLRMKPHDLEAIYTLHADPPRDTVILIDDVLTTGAHFVAARNVIRAQYPEARVIGMFIARRVPSNPFEDFEAL